MKLALTGRRVYVTSMFLIASVCAYGIYFYISQKRLLSSITGIQLASTQVYFQQLEKEETDNVRARADSISGTIARLSTIQLEYAQNFNLQKEGISSTLEPFMDYREIAGIEVTDKTGRPYAAMWREDGKVIFRADYALPPAFTERYTFVVKKPAVANGETQGHVTVYQDGKAINDAAMKLRDQLAEISDSQVAKLESHFAHTRVPQLVVLLFGIVFIILVAFFTSRSYKLIERQGHELALLNQRLEKRVGERTHELSEANRDLKETQASLVHASRMAGMSEVATGILHNVGNVLNSVNVSTNLILAKMKEFKTDILERVVGLFRENAANLGDFVANDPRGKKVPVLLEAMTRAMADDKADVVTECQTLMEKVNHIKSIVQAHQKFGKMSSLVSSVDLKTIVSDALELCKVLHSLSQVTTHRDDVESLMIATDPHKVLQILVNLLQNAAQAVTTSDRRDIYITLEGDDHLDHVAVCVRDTGRGMSAETMDKLFTFGFTTRAEGHGTGLHMSAIAAKELGGSLSGTSDGEGRGARFTLTLPRTHPDAAPPPS